MSGARLGGLCCAGLLLAIPAVARAQAGTSAMQQSRRLAAAAQAARQDRLAEARSLVEAILSEDPTSAPALVLLYQVLAREDAAGEALPWVERALAETVDSPDRQLRQVWIRALEAAGSRDSATVVAQRWTRERPEDPAAWAEWARTLADARRPDEAVEALREGRRRIGSRDAFAQELAALLASRGRWDAAAAEWVRVLSWGDAGVSAVRAAIEQRAGDRGAAIRALRAAVREVESFPARRGELALAVALGDEEWARETGERLADALPAEAARAVLMDLLVDARNRGWIGTAADVAGRLAEMADSPGERRTWEITRAGMLLAGGDTARAGSIAERIAGTADPGPARRRAVRLLFELRLAGDPDAAEDLLDRYLDEPGVDGEQAGAMAAALARARARRGELEEAEAALQRADGLVTDDSTFARLELQRGWLRLMQGRPGAALSALEAGAAVPSGDPTARAEALLFADALGRADSIHAAGLGTGLRALVADGDAGPLTRAADAWLEEPEAASDAGPALVGLAAAALERSGRIESAGDLRSRLVEAWPDAPEAPFALLELGREAARDDPVRAREWLRRLVVEYPESPAAPLARRMLGELEGRVPAAGAEVGP